MSDLKELKLEDLEVGMYVEASQLKAIRGVYIFIDAKEVSHSIAGEIVHITKELDDYTEALRVKESIKVFYLPDGLSLGGFKVYE